MEKELISVVVPIYNVEAYLRKSVDSILNQTYQNLEIILVDDGGKDNCPAICDEYAKSDARIKVIHKVNGGLSDARNAGVKEATGDYIAFVDSDDYLKPNMYEEMLKRMQAEDADIAVCNYECVTTDGEPIKERNQILPISDETIDSKSAIEHLCGTSYEYWVTAWNRLYKAEIAKAVSFPKGKIHEDEFTAHLFYDKALRISGISEPFYQYVIREDSIMTKKYSVKNLAYVEALNQRIAYCIEHNMKEVSLAFVRWMAKYLMKVYPQLDMADTDTKTAYKKCKKLFWESYHGTRRAWGLDAKTVLMAALFCMPKSITAALEK